MKQTAVDWIVEQLWAPCKTIPSDVIEKAKKLEKIKMESCAIHMINYAIDCIEGKKKIDSKIEFEKYYKEKYEK